MTVVLGIPSSGKVHYRKTSSFIMFKFGLTEFVNLVFPPPPFLNYSKFGCICQNIEGTRI